MWIILFWLICSIAIIAERAVYLYGASINKEVFLATMQKCILAGDVAKAVKMASAANAPLARIVQAGLVKVNRPDAKAAKEIFAKYLTGDLPFHATAAQRYGEDPARIAAGMIDETITRMYAASEENKFLEVTYAKGEREIFYFKDFSSGAMIKNIVDRAKKKAVKRQIMANDPGIKLEHILEAVREEFKENEDLPNTTNPDDWARISGRKGEKIINVRTLISGISRTERTIETVGGSGQYL